MAPDVRDPAVTIGTHPVTRARSIGTASQLVASHGRRQRARRHKTDHNGDNAGAAHRHGSDSTTECPFSMSDAHDFACRACGKMTCSRSYANATSVGDFKPAA